MKIQVKPLSPFWQLAGFLVSQTINRLVTGSAFLESPQETHRWNYQKLSKKEMLGLSQRLMVFQAGDSSQLDSHIWRFPMCHVPILGGWKKYQVLCPIGGMTWRVGWIAGNSIAVSRIILRTPVRMLYGNKDTYWFGLSEDGEQLDLRRIAYGSIGDGSNLRLL